MVRRIAFASVAVVVLGIAAPGVYLAYRYTARLAAGWVWWILLSPAVYLWAAAAFSAITQPLQSLIPLLPLFETPQGSARVAAGMALWRIVWAALSAAFWWTIAWGSFPLIGAREVRFVPFWPWPS